MTEMQSELSELKNLIGELRELVEGGRNRDVNPGVMGLVRKNQSEIETLKINVAVLKTTIDRFKWTLTGWVTVGAIVGGAIVKTWIG